MSHGCGMTEFCTSFEWSQQQKCSWLSPTVYLCLILVFISLLKYIKCILTLSPSHFQDPGSGRRNECVMQFPGTILHWIIFVTSLWLIPVTQGQYDICYFKDNVESCHHGTFDALLLTLPDNICFTGTCGDLEDCLLCSDCSVANWVTFA